MANEQGYYETRRLQLHEVLKTLLGSNHVYFQPPESIKLSYPCIIYERYDIKNTHADDMRYLGTCVFKIIVIDSDPTSEIVEKVSMEFPTIKFNRHYVSDRLNHDVFILTY